MKDAWIALLSSRKFWIGTISMGAVFASVFLRAKGLIPADALVPTISAIATAGLAGVLGIAWEGTTKAKTDSAAAVAMITSMRPGPIVPSDDEVKP